MIHITIPGEPQGKARARTFYHRTAKRIVSMTPDKTQNYEALIKQIAQDVAGDTYFDGKIEMTIKAYYEIAASDKGTKKRNKEQNITRPTKKPDADNIAKVVCDSLNKVVYKDDTQVVRLIVEKWYTVDKPRVEVEIREAV
jgi:Holliday junction resolvase RusA-like endonuclease